MGKEYTPEEKLEMWQENMRWEDAIRREFIAMVEESLADPSGVTREPDPTQPLEHFYKRERQLEFLLNRLPYIPNNQSNFDSDVEFNEWFDSLLNKESDTTKTE